MAGNPYHDADGKFCAKDTAMKSYENEINEAIQSGNSERARNLQTDYESMMIEADPQSDVAQKALQRDYGTLNKFSNKKEREEKKREKQLLKSDKNTQKITDKFNKLYNKYKSQGYSEEAIEEKFYQSGNTTLYEDSGMYHPDKIVKPVGNFEEVPVSEAQPGDIITISMYPNPSGPFNYTARIKTAYMGDHILLHNPTTRMNSLQNGYVLGDSLEDLRNSKQNNASIIISVIRDEGATEFLREDEERKQKREEQEQKLEELERKKRELEKEMYETRGY